MPAEPNWRDSLPDDLKGSASLARYNDVPDLAKAYVHMEKFRGNSISIPGEDAGDEQRQEFVDKLLNNAPNVMMRPDMDNADQSRDFYRTLGMPEKSDGYEVPKMELPEGQPINEERITFFRELAHNIGLTKSQFSNFVKAITEQDVTEFTSRKSNQEAEITSLKKEWGDATKDRIAETLSIAERTKAPESLIEAIKKNEVTSDMMKWMYGIHVSIGKGEGTNMSGIQTSTSGKMSPSEAKEKIAEMYANKDHAFHRGDKDAMKRMIELVTAANPGSDTNVNSLRAGMNFEG